MNARCITTVCMVITLAGGVLFSATLSLDSPHRTGTARQTLSRTVDGTPVSPAILPANDRNASCPAAPRRLALLGLIPSATTPDGQRSTQDRRFTDSRTSRPDTNIPSFLLHCQFLI